MEQISLKTNHRAERQSNMELLRIFAILMIIGHHLARHSGFQFTGSELTINRLWIQFLRIGGKLGVNIFVLISGWFLSASEVFRTNKVIKLWLQIFTYAIAIYAVTVAFGIKPFSGYELLKRFFPITFGCWWFASTYFVLLIFVPFLNRLLHLLNKKQYLGLLCLMGVLWCIIPTIANQAVQSNNFVWFIFVYTLAGYLRMHAAKPKHGAWFYLLLACLSVLFIFGSAVLFDHLSASHPFFESKIYYFYDIRTIPILAAAVFFFLGFSQINIGSVRWINVISSAVFGVYLLHDDNIIRPLLWKKLLAPTQYVHRLRMIPFTLLFIAAIFVCGIVVELLRIYLLERLYLKSVDRLGNAVDKARDKLLSKWTHS